MVVVLFGGGGSVWYCLVLLGTAWYCLEHRSKYCLVFCPCMTTTTNTHACFQWLFCFLCCLCFLFQCLFILYFHGLLPFPHFPFPLSPFPAISLPRSPQPPICPPSVQPHGELLFVIFVFVALFIDLLTDKVTPLSRFYTSVGPILVSVNPFKWITGLYSQDVIQYFVDSRFAYDATLKRHAETPPHTFAVAERAFIALASEEAR